MNDLPPTAPSLPAIQKLLRATLDSSIDVIQVFEAVRNEQGEIVDFTWLLNNHASEKIYGDVIGQSLLQLQPGVVEEGIFAAFKQVVETGEPQQYEKHYVHEQFDGWFHQSVVKLNDGVATTTADITARKKAEDEAAQHATDKYFSIFNSIDEGFYLCEVLFDEANHPVDILYLEENPAAVRMIGQSFVGKRLREISPLYEEYWYQIWGNAALTGTSQRLERYSEADQKWFSFLVSKLGGAESRQVTVTFQDITERAQAEDALRESEERYATLFAASPVPFMVLAPNPPDFTITAANEACFKATFTTLQTLIGRRLFDVFPDDSSRPGQLGSEALAISLDYVLSTKRTDMMERVRYDILTPEGGFQPHWWEAINMPMLDRFGQVIAIIHQVTRVTELRFAEEKERQNQERQAFLLKLSDAVRPLSDSGEMERTAMRMLGHELSVNRAFFATVDPDGEFWSIRHDYAEGVPSNAGRYPMSEFQRKRLAQWQAGRMSSVADSEADPRLSAADRAAYAAFGTRAAIAVPLVKGGRFAALLSVNQDSPRVWTEAELTLTSEAAERTWAAIARARVEESLRISEEKYRTLFESIDEGFGVIELLYNEAGKPIDYVFHEVNSAYERITGQVNPSGKLGSEVSPNIEPYWLDTYDNVVQTGESIRHERYHGDTSRWYSAFAYRMGTEGSRMVAIVFDDITERKLSEQRQQYLLKLNDLLRLTSDAAEIEGKITAYAMDYFGADRCYYCAIENDYAITLRDAKKPGLPSVVGSYPLSGYPILKKVLDNLAPFIVENVSTSTILDVSLKELCVGLNIISFIVVPVVKDNTVTGTICLAQATPRYWKEAEINLAFVTAERAWAEIERAKAEAALRESEEQFRLLSIASSDSIYTMSPDWTQMRQLIGKSFLTDTLDPSSTWLDTYIPVEDQPRVQQVIQEAIRTQSTFELEHRVKQADGTIGWTFSRAIPILNEQGAIQQWLGAASDITARKQAEEALLQADQRKDEFLAMLAHELRNPMSTIRSGLQILTLAVEEDELIGTTVEMMNRQTDHLVRMVDDLLDVSRINRGKIDLKKGRLNLVELVQQAVQSCQPLFQQGQTLHVDLPATPIYVEGDATRLTQVVTNLLTNAARYTGEQGQVWLRLAQPSDGQEALIQVRDNGIGLAADQLSAIFELFVQVDNSVARSKGGLGLGLTLVKRLVELHGGRAEAQSEGLGQGSTFRVYVPTLATVAEPTVKPVEQANESSSARRILVVDDNADAAFTLAMLLKLKGYEAHTRNSGRAGIEAAQSLQPAAILLDIGMPELDGYATCRLIRQQPWGKNMVVIALTGYGQEEDRQRTREAGFNGHLVKPVDLGMLTKLLSDLLDNHRTEPD